LQTISVLRYSVNENCYRFTSQTGVHLYICICNAVTDKAVAKCAEEGARSVEELTAKLGVGAGCGRCRECAMDLLREACKSACAPAPVPA
jgi:bacterioferritin-associated ferredoxin